MGGRRHNENNQMERHVLKTDEQQTKLVISALVQDYVTIFPEEFLAFKNGIRDKRDNALTKYAETPGSETFIRELGEYPTTLYNLFLTRLSFEQMEWLKSKKGAIWFFKKYPAFSVAKVI